MKKNSKKVEDFQFPLTIFYLLYVYVDFKEQLQKEKKNEEGGRGRGRRKKIREKEADLQIKQIPRHSLHSNMVILKLSTFQKEMLKSLQRRFSSSKDDIITRLPFFSTKSLRGRISLFVNRIPEVSSATFHGYKYSSQEKKKKFHISMLTL